MSEVISVKELDLVSIESKIESLLVLDGEKIGVTSNTPTLIQPTNTEIQLVLIQDPQAILYTSEALAFISDTCVPQVGGGSLDIYDEFGLVRKGVTEINFIGTQIVAKDAGDGRVNVFVPQPTYASHFNSNDGVASSLVHDYSVSNRFIGLPTREGVPYAVGDWAGGQIHQTVNTPLLSYHTLAPCSIADLITTFTVSILGADGITRVSTFTTPPITANGVFSSPDTSMVVTVSSWNRDIDRYQANIAVSFNLALVLPSGGRFGISIAHLDSTEGIFSKYQNNLFYDTNTNIANASTLTIAQGFANSWKYLSGIRYYSLGDTFFINIPQLDNLNSNSYPQPFIAITCDDFGISDVAVSGGDLDSWSYQWDNVAASYTALKEITQPNFRFVGAARVAAQILDWGVAKTLISDPQNVLIDTYARSSTDQVENFDDEYYRQDSGFNGGTPYGNWLSDLPLKDGEGMVFGGFLIHPAKAFTIDHAPSQLISDFSNYLPLHEDGTTNSAYTRFGGEFNYYRTFLRDDPYHDTPNYQIYMTGNFVTGSVVGDIEQGYIEIYIRRVNTNMDGFFGPEVPPMTVHGEGYSTSFFDDGVTNGCVRLGNSQGSMIGCTAGGVTIHGGVYFHLRVLDPTIKVSSIRLEFN